MLLLQSTHGRFRFLQKLFNVRLDLAGYAVLRPSEVGGGNEFKTSVVVQHGAEAREVADAGLEGRSGLF